MNATTVLCSLSEGRFGTSLHEAQILIWNHDFLVLGKVQGLHTNESKRRASRKCGTGRPRVLERPWGQSSIKDERRRSLRRLEQNE